MDIRAKTLATQQRNRAAFARAKPKQEGMSIEFKPRDIKNSYILTFFDMSGPYRRYRFGSDATSFGAMMEYLEALPMYRQLRAAGISPAIFPSRKSSLTVDLDDEQRMMLIMCLPREVMMQRYDETPEYRRGVSIKPEQEPMKRWSNY
jgi:hypothetical protein